MDTDIHAVVTFGTIILCILLEICSHNSRLRCPGHNRSPKDRVSLPYPAPLSKLLNPVDSDLALYSALNADASAVFNIDASATATIDSGVKDLFSVGLPGLDFPGMSRKSLMSVATC